MQRLLVILSFVALGLLSACAGRQGELRPLDPTPTGAASFSRQPQLVTFGELQANPQIYLDRFIRVTGAFGSAEGQTCQPRSGPVVTWSLIADDLRLDVVGFEDLSGRVAENEPFTVDGYFRLYEGPLGCGKEPPVDNVWYLAIDRVVQPNPIRFADGTLAGPLPGVTAASGSGAVGAGTPPLPQPESTESVGQTPDATQVGPGTLPAAATANGTAAATPNLSLTPSRAVPTATPATRVTSTALPSQTPTPGPSPTATPTVTATTQAGPTSTPLPTATTTDGYPGPATSTPEGDPDPYPDP